MSFAPTIAGTKAGKGAARTEQVDEFLDELAFPLLFAVAEGDGDGISRGQEVVDVPTAGFFLAQVAANPGGSMALGAPDVGIQPWGKGALPKGTDEGVNRCV